MIKNRGYQYNFSEILHKQMYNKAYRRKKAKTIIAVLCDFYHTPLKDLSVIDIGSSTGIIANYCADYFGSVTGIDIDENAIKFAGKNFRKNNLQFFQQDSMSIDFTDGKFDVVICAQVYEHVPDAKKLMSEIHKILKPGGICYFAAGNRLNVQEAHYNLPFLSVIPRPFAHLYIKTAGKADFYYEKHFSYWGLRNLVSSFKLIDYTIKITNNPDQFHTRYMLPKNMHKTRIAKLVVNHLYWLFPTYIWLLQKPLGDINK